MMKTTLLNSFRNCISLHSAKKEQNTFFDEENFQGEVKTKGSHGSDVYGTVYLLRL